MTDIREDTDVLTELRKQTEALQRIAAALAQLEPLIQRFDRTAKTPAGRLFLGRLG
ncbi:MAG TPA: hypothetical protein VLU24_10240 [Mycobacterium sp.]|nr:hypothetical protein [Mycobacterium sp.]